MTPTVHLFITAFGSAFGFFVAIGVMALVYKMFEDRLEEPGEDRLAAVERSIDELRRDLDMAKRSWVPAVLEVVEEGMPPKPVACIVCSRKRVPIKAKGKCKRCYERILGRERRARARAKTSSKCCS